MLEKIESNLYVYWRLRFSLFIFFKKHIFLMWGKFITALHCGQFGMIPEHQRREKIELMTSLQKIDLCYISMTKVHYREQSLVIATARIIIMGTKPWANLVHTIFFKFSEKSFKSCEIFRYQEVTASRVHPRCAYAHNCLGPTLVR